MKPRLSRVETAYGALWKCKAADSYAVGYADTLSEAYWFWHCWYIQL